MSVLLPLAQGDDFFTDRSGAGGACPSNNNLCPGWIVDNFDQFTEPLREHIVLSVVPLIIGSVLATALALLAHRVKWLGPIFSAFVTTLFTVPSIAFFLILLNVTGRGTDTAIIVLTAYTQVLVYLNVATGLREVPDEMVDAARGMGLSRMQTLFRVEVPLALPTILAGVRIAASSTVGIAGFAYLAGAGGLGQPIASDTSFQGRVLTCALLMVLLAAVLELIVLAVQRLLTPWQRAVAT